VTHSRGTARGLKILVAGSNSVQANDFLDSVIYLTHHPCDFRIYRNQFGASHQTTTALRSISVLTLVQIRPLTQLENDVSNHDQRRRPGIGGNRICHINKARLEVKRARIVPSTRGRSGNLHRAGGAGARHELRRLLQRISLAW
jgi:hypothetical protein